MIRINGLLVCRDLLFVIAFILASCSSPVKQAVDYVDPFIGTGGHGHTFPGVTLPHVLVQLSPDTRLTDWDACGGYHYNDSSLLGFSHIHISGTGIGDYGDILFLPFTGEPLKIVRNGVDRDLRYGSRFSREREEASPGYYQVHLKDYDVIAELSATMRTGLHRYTYPESAKAGLLIDLVSSVYLRKCLAAELKVLSDTEICGMKHVQGWAPDRKVFFHAEFSKPFTALLEVDGEKKVDLTEAASTCLRAFLDFNDTAAGEQVVAKVGVSFVDYEGARKNLEAEARDGDFDSLCRSARDIWEAELSKIEVTSDDETAKTIFYTSLYHALIAPNVCSDVDGRYRTMKQEIAQSDTYTNYTVFSLWDTFRSLHPLFTVIAKERNEAMIRSLLEKYDEGGMLPMWELASNYTGTMIGYHAVSVIVDAYMKGHRDFDVEKAYEACKRSSAYDSTGIAPAVLSPIGKRYKNSIGYIPSDKDRTSVSKGLEYAYNDWLIAQFAKDRGEEADFHHYSKLGKHYVHYFDSSTGFMRGKLSDGTWVSPFSPSFSAYNSDYCEGNAWQWAWFVPHDIEGLVSLMGGRANFIAKLDSLFSVSSELEGEFVPLDITGMIGQYAHGNEPSHQTIHIYNVIGEPWKAQALIDEVLRTLYLAKPDGISGNEDCGQMSAWYVLNSMGFFPYCPGIPEYSLARPLFDKVTIRLGNGKTFVIEAMNNGVDNKYIQYAELNGQLLERPFFTHAELEEGGILKLQMGPEPNLTWGYKDE